ncbi:MAG: OadG family protein [Lactobacillales bacterium]|jgi:sodium pump decarboxylase gamma subunit|nr:OadG family protein [Lactobacillales bacterium]
MLSQALMITLLGMGGVFFFLYLLIEVINFIALISPPDPAPAEIPSADLSKVAAAVAVAQKIKGDK